jgi:hypothetical protein
MSLRGIPPCDNSCSDVVEQAPATRRSRPFVSRQGRHSMGDGAQAGRPCALPRGGYQTRKITMYDAQFVVGDA